MAASRIGYQMAEEEAFVAPAQVGRSQLNIAFLTDGGGHEKSTTTKRLLQNSTKKTGERDQGYFSRRVSPGTQQAPRSIIGLFGREGGVKDYRVCSCSPYKSSWGTQVPWGMGVSNPRTYRHFPKFSIDKTSKCFPLSGGMCFLPR